jgi:hypothetical protein
MLNLLFTASALLRASADHNSLTRLPVDLALALFLVLCVSLDLFPYGRLPKLKSTSAAYLRSPLSR